jgi:hypothetical protein
MSLLQALNMVFIPLPGKVVLSGEFMNHFSSDTILRVPQGQDVCRTAFFSNKHIVPLELYQKR